MESWMNARLSRSGPSNAAPFSVRFIAILSTSLNKLLLWLWGIAALIIRLNGLSWELKYVL
eukprot:4702576-Amphidinium_carterae.1